MCRTTEGLVGRSIRWGVCLVAMLGVPTAARAQAPLARLIPAALADAARNDDFRTPEDHTRHFVTGVDLTPVPAEVNAALGLQMTTFPVNAAWEGRPGPWLGDAPEAPAWLPVARSSFAERATTLGRGAFTFGLTQQSLHYRALDGLDVEDGEMKFFLQHNNCCGRGADPSAATDRQPAFERDLLEQTLSVDVDRNVFNFVLGHGVSDRFDVGLALPLVKVNLRTRVTSRLLRTATEASPITHKFDALELANQTSYASGTAHGLGDIALHAKYAVVETSGGGLAGSLDVTLPTGDSDDLLGTGVTRLTGRAIWSEQVGRVGTHVNASYTWSSGELSGAFDAPADPEANVARAPLDLTVPDEIGVVAGADVALVSRFGVSADLVMRRLRGLSRFAAGETVFPSRGPGASATGAFVAPDDLQITGRERDLTQLFAAIGARLHLGRLLLLNADVLVPVVDHGFVPHGVVVGVNVGY